MNPPMILARTIIEQRFSRIMNDEDDDKTTKRHISAEKAADAFYQRLSEFKPVTTYTFDLPMDVTIGTAGDILLDCPCLMVPNHPNAGIVRVRLTPAAADSLRRVLEQLGKSLDEPPGAPTKRPTH